MTLGQKLTIDALRGDLKDLAGLLDQEVQYQGPSWKEPNKKSASIELDDYLEQFVYQNDADDDRRAQVGLLEALIDRLHFLVLSLAECDSKSFVSLGKAARKLSSKVNHLRSHRDKQRGNINTLQASINQSLKSKGSDLYYSPNYEEDLRREMFPIIDNLITALAKISDAHAIPSASSEIWSQTKHNFDKTALVKITSSIKKDLERVSKLLDKMDRQKRQLQKELSSQLNSIKVTGWNLSLF